MRISVVGAGAVGARVARQLVSTEGIDDVVVRDTDDERLEKVVESLGAGASAERGPYLRPPDADVHVLAVPPGVHATLARDYLPAGRPVVSTSDAVEDVRGLLDLGPEAAERGVRVVAGAGFSPGLTCVLAAHAATLFDEVEEIHVAKVGTGGPACARQHHRALAGRAVDWRDGGWLERRGGSGRELCWFPDPIGGQDCYRAALPDALLLVRAFPGVRRVTARVAANRRNRLTARLPRLRPPHPEGGPGGVRVEVRGRRGEERSVVAYGAMDRPAVAAGAVAAVAAVLAGRGALDGAGVTGLAEAVGTTAFLGELRSRGVRAAVFEGTGVEGTGVERTGEAPVGG